MKIKFLIQLSLMLLVFLVFVTSCNEDTPDTSDNTSEIKGLVKSFPAEASWEWNEIFLKVERYAAGYRPGPAPRALALMGLAAYEACVTGMPDYKSVKSLYPALVIPPIESGKTYHWPTVIHAVYTTMFPRFFVDASGNPSINPSVQPLVNQLITKLNAKYEIEAGSNEIYNRSRAYGQEVGLNVWNWSTTDAVGYKHYLDPFEKYVWQDHYKGPGNWVPTKPGPDKPMGGVYGGARTFANFGQQLICRSPSYYDMDYSENPKSTYFGQALETYSLTRKDFETKWVGEFWSDDLLNLTFSPGPRWVAIANQVIAIEKSNLETAVFCYVKVGMAISDAAVGAWHSKYLYNVERPQTYIQKVIDPTYVSALDNPLTGDRGFTPPFPAYPSGHSTMGGAGAEALSSVFGYRYSMTDNCHKNRNDFYGMSRTFESFYAMAEENAWSRVPLGVHWRMDCTEGVRFGYAIGEAVNKLPWKK